MSQSRHTKPPTRTDTVWQVAYRLGFPLARLWWRLRRQRHEGALVAVHVGLSVLLLRSSYRSAWNFPGGSIRPGETPEAAARRELAEEIGLVFDVPLRPVGEVRGVWDGRQDRVFLFALRLDQPPALRLDYREIIGARLVLPDALPGLLLTGPVRAYVDGRISSGAERGLPDA
jgi:8-oxo-dGTP pyrophosphatase MutT (NUDIX family)